MSSSWCGPSQRRAHPGRKKSAPHERSKENRCARCGRFGGGTKSLCARCQAELAAEQDDQPEARPEPPSRKLPPASPSATVWFTRRTALPHTSVIIVARRTNR